MPLARMPSTMVGPFRVHSRWEAPAANLAALANQPTNQLATGHCRWKSRQPPQMGGGNLKRLGPVGARRLVPDASSPPSSHLRVACPWPNSAMPLFPIQSTRAWPADLSPRFQTSRQKVKRHVKCTRRRGVEIEHGPARPASYLVHMHRPSSSVDARIRHSQLTREICLVISRSSTVLPYGTIWYSRCLLAFSCRCWPSYSLILARILRHGVSQPCSLLPCPSGCLSTYSLSRNS